MKFKLQHTPLIYGLLTAIIIISLFSVVLNILIMTEVGAFVCNDYTLPVVSTVCSVLLFALCLSVVFGSDYIITDAALIIAYGIIRTKVPVATVLAVVEQRPQKQLILQYKTVNRKSEENFAFLAVSVKAEFFEDFVKALQSKNADIKYNIVDLTSDKDDLNVEK